MASVDASYRISSAERNSGLSVPVSTPETRVQIGSVPRSRVSSFDITLLSAQTIRKRDLHDFSVHYSVATSSWVTRITSLHTTDESGRCLRFSFPTEHDARKFGKAYSPPKMMVGGTRCFCCSTAFGSKCTSRNCMNCGVQICETCSSRWGLRMIPKTYLKTPITTSSDTVRVCKSCNWLSNAFCMALLQGQHNNAVVIQATGNVNLRCTFAAIHKEAMFPIHCAVMGGNLDLVKWLVEAHGCPLSVNRNTRLGVPQSVQTSKGRSLMDLAMTGRAKIDILEYLVSKNLSVMDTNDPALAAKTLQSLMSSGSRNLRIQNPCNASDGSVSTLDDACIICYEKQMNCVFAPCGHQACCSDCGNKLTHCPLCKQAGSVLRIFKG